MKLVMTLYVRDEVDIIEANLRYHLLAGVDHFIVTDNRSVDGTTDILKRYQAAGFLDYRYESSTNHEQSQCVTMMARSAALDHDADWVIDSDADEFWWPEEGDLKSTLASVPGDIEVLDVLRYNFLARPIQAGRTWLDEMVLRRAEAINDRGKKQNPKVIHRGAERLIVTQGNHAVFRHGERVPSVETSAIKILHFPVRSLAQIERKIDYIGSAYDRGNHEPHVGGSKRALYARLSEEGLGEYFGSQSVDDDALDQELASGRIVRDERLRDRLAGWSGSGS